MSARAILRTHPRTRLRLLLLEDEPLVTRSRKRTPPTIIFWTSLINREFAAAFILSVETRDCRIPFRNIVHGNKPKTSRSASFAISDQFDFGNGAERLKEFSQCAFCHVKGNIADV